MSQLHKTKRFTLQRLDLLKGNVMLDHGHSDGETILDNYFTLLGEISTSQTEEEVLGIALTEAVLLASS